MADQSRSEDYGSIMLAAISIAHEAGSLIGDLFGQTQEVTFKGEVDPVTEADTQAEALILSRLRETFPEHRIVGEEGGVLVDVPEESEDTTLHSPTWLVDPLDGTNNFAHGFPHFAVSIGLLDKGEPVVGVIHDPLRDETFSAAAGSGARLNGQPIQVSNAKKLEDAFLATGFPYNRRTAADINVKRLGRLLRRCQGVRRAGAATLDLAYVACGRFDGFWEIRLNPWDVTAGILIVREAGGRVTDFAGTKDCLSGAEVVASNGHFHAELLEEMQGKPELG
jgi:myo-inositol-1(or 4)-monophosphatase